MDESERHLLAIWRSLPGPQQEKMMRASLGFLTEARSVDPHEPGVAQPPLHARMK
jgi:hypothetical protein